MPFDVTMPDGTVIQGVPDGMTKAQLAQKYQSHVGAGSASQDTQTTAPPPSGFMGTVEDMARSIPGGLAKGVAGIAGLPGDVNSLLSAGGDKVLQMLGESPENLQKMQNIRQNIPLAAPTSGAINDAISKPFGGYYDPKTTAGQYTQTAASFAPNALMPGTAAQRLARVLVPAGTSETAGQLAHAYAPNAEPLARAGGALVGGIGEGLGEGWANSGSAIKSAISPEDLAKAKTAAYTAADQAGVIVKPQSFQKFATDFGADFTKNNVVNAEIHKGALAGLASIQDEAALGQPISLSRLDSVRQAVNDAVSTAAASPNGGDMRLAMKVKEGFDGYVKNLGASDVLAGDPAVAVPLLTKARDLASREFKSDQIQKMIDLAQNSASTNYSSAGYEQALRVQFKNLNAQLIQHPSLAATYSDAEQDAIKDVARGGPIGNALRYFGKWMAGGPVSASAGVGLGAGVGSMVGGPAGAMIGAAVVPAVGGAARLGATAITQRNADLAGALMRAGKPLASQAPSALQRTSPALLAAILSQSGAQ